MTAPDHPLLHRILSTTNTPWNNWTSCLVYHHKAVDEMSDWMERMHRFEVIMLTHIYPQVAEIAHSDAEFEQMINKVEPDIFAMAIADNTGVMIPSNSESNHTTPTTHTFPHI